MDATARTRRASLTGAALAVAAVLTAGCSASSLSTGAGSSGSTPSSAGGATSAAPGSGTAAATTSSGASGAAGGTTSSGASGSAGGSSSGTGSSSAAGCSTARLKASLGDSEGAAGSDYTVIDFTNTGSTSCTLYGYPGVSLDNSGGQIGAAATRDPSHGAPKQVTLAPGAVANAIVRVTNAQNYPSGTCSPDAASFLKIYPPNQTASIDVPYKSTGCQKSSVKLLTITVIASGAGSASQ